MGKHLFKLLGDLLIIQDGSKIPKSFCFLFWRNFKVNVLLWLNCGKVKSQKLWNQNNLINHTNRLKNKISSVLTSLLKTSKVIPSVKWSIPCTICCNPSIWRTKSKQMIMEKCQLSKVHNFLLRSIISLSPFGPFSDPKTLSIQKNSNESNKGNG